MKKLKLFFTMKEMKILKFFYRFTSEFNNKQFSMSLWLSVRCRFPADFMFQLTREEKREVVTNCDHLEKLKFSTVNPYAFTEHGAIMAASVLNSLSAALPQPKT